MKALKKNGLGGGLVAALLVMAVLGLVSLTGCASLGIASKGADYFIGKTEEDLTKYFKYEGKNVSFEGDYDKALSFTNLVTTMYMDKTTIQKFKNRRYNMIMNFEFLELYDGCYIYQNTNSNYTPHVTLVNGRVASHTNRNQDIKSQINLFINYIQQYGAVKAINDDAMFERTNIGNTYYIYNITSYDVAYSDGAGSGAGNYTYTLQSVSVFEDSKSSTETHTAYIYNDKERQYTDEKGNPISKEQALSNENSYLMDGFTNRRKDNGIALIAYIKDGIVVAVTPSENSIAND